MNASWKYDTCTLCAGSGKIKDGTCPICKGQGLWEFMSEENDLAVQALLSGQPATDEIKQLCDRRLKQLTPDNYDLVLRSMEKGIKVQHEAAFNAIQDSGSKRWTWAWLHTNRFAVELCRLCGGNPTKYRLGLSLLAWKWLSEENPKKVDASIDIPEVPLL